MPTRADARRPLSPRRASWPALVEDFIAYYHARGFSRSWGHYARRVLPCFFDFLVRRRVRDLRAIEEADVVGFLAELLTTPSQRGEPLGPSSRKSWLRTLRVFFRHLVRHRLILASPAAALKLPKFWTLPRRVLSEAEVRRLIASPGPTGQRHLRERPFLDLRDRAVLELLYGTGMRLTECVRLDLSDVRFGEGELLIRQGKWRKDRVVPLVGRAALALARYLQEARPRICRRAGEGALFVSRCSRRLSTKRVQSMLSQHARVAKIEGRVSPHMLRHACATHLLRHGASVRHVQELLGHRQLETTMVYTRVELSDLRRVFAKSHPRNEAHGRGTRSVRGSKPRR